MELSWFLFWFIEFNLKGFFLLLLKKERKKENLSQETQILTVISWSFLSRATVSHFNCHARCNSLLAGIDHFCPTCPLYEISAKNCFVRDEKLIQTLQVSKSPYIWTVKWFSKSGYRVICSNRRMTQWVSVNGLIALYWFSKPYQTNIKTKLHWQMYFSKWTAKTCYLRASG